jgi:hypothetical protein
MSGTRHKPNSLNGITARSVAFIGDENARCAPAFPWNGKERAMQVRRRLKQALSLNDRLKIFSDHLKAQASRLPPGPEQDALFKKARIAETASHIDEWANSPGLRPPRDSRRP